MFRIQIKYYSNLLKRMSWKELYSAPNGNRFETEAEAWAYVEGLNDSGARDTDLYRVVPSQDEA